MPIVRRLYNKVRCCLLRWLPARFPSSGRFNIWMTVSYNDASRHLVRYAGLAENGQVIIIEPESAGAKSVVMISTQLWDAMLDRLLLSVHSAELHDGHELSIAGLPIHGHGKTAEEALVHLAKAVMSYCAAYAKSTEKQALEPYAQALVLKLMRLVNDRNKLMRQLSDSITR